MNRQKKSLVRLGLALAAVGLLAPAGPARAGSCAADASLANSWEERGGFKLNAKFRVEPEGCSGYCNGYVEFRITYQREDGWSNSCSGMTRWSLDTSRQLAAETVGDCRAMLCSDSSGKSCTISDVAITRISCYD